MGYLINIAFRGHMVLWSHGSFQLLRIILQLSQPLRLLFLLKYESRVTFVDLSKMVLVFSELKHPFFQL